MRAWVGRSVGAVCACARAVAPTSDDDDADSTCVRVAAPREATQENMSVLARLLSTLRHELAARKEEDESLSPPVPAAETAAKGLRQLLSKGQAADASEAQVQMARAANVELFASDAYGKLLCAWISEATRTIHKIDVASEVDTAEAGLARWGHLRVNLLSALLYMASSVSPQDDAAQGRCVELLEKTEKHDADSSDDAAGGAATVCLNLLESHAARVDLSGVQHATNLLRNLALPPSNRALIGRLARGEGSRDPLSVLLLHAGHADAQVAMQVAATLRILAEGCPANVLAYLRTSHAEGGGIGGGGIGGGDGGNAGNGGNGGNGGGVDGPPVPHALSPLLCLDLSRIHPHARVELSRFACTVVAATSLEPDDESCGLARLRGMCGAAGLAAASDEAEPDGAAALASVGFPCFLLGSNHRPLHVEACAALRNLRRAAAAQGDGWAGFAFAVHRQGREMPLREAIQQLREAGQLTAEDCEGLLQQPESGSQGPAVAVS